MDIKSQILADPKSFLDMATLRGQGQYIFLALSEFIFEEKPRYTSLLIDMAAHLINVRAFLNFENKTLSKTRVFSREKNLMF